MEIWKDINGYEGLYQVSNEGRIKSLARSWCNSKRVKPESILKPFYSRKYEVVELSNNGAKRIYYIHRLVAAHFLENPFNLPEVNHEDCNTKNNHATNLKWCNKWYNTAHAVRNGLLLKRKGSENPSAVLTESDVIVIRKRREAGESYSSIAKTYSVDQSNIALITKRKSWKHVQ